jgi:hypothetical protein
LEPSVFQLQNREYQYRYELAILTVGVTIGECRRRSVASESALVRFFAVLRNRKAL